MIPSISLFCPFDSPVPSDIQMTITYVKEKQQILTSKNLEPENQGHFILEMIIKINRLSKQFLINFLSNNSNTAQTYYTIDFGGMTSTEISCSVRKAACVGQDVFLKKTFYHSKESKGVKRKMNDGFILFSCFSLRVLALCMLAHCHTIMAYWNT